MEDPYWQSFMEQAVRLIYFLAESPDQLCSRLLQRSARLLLDQIAEGGDINKDAGQAEDGSQEPGESGEQGASPRVVIDRHSTHSPPFGPAPDRCLRCVCPPTPSELCLPGAALGSVWQRGFLAGVSP